MSTHVGRAQKVEIFRWDACEVDEVDEVVRKKKIKIKLNSTGTISLFLRS